jgi:DNA-binding transcriptional MerR regulator
VEYYSIGKFANLIGVTKQCLRNWDITGRLKPHHKTETGYRYYSNEQLYHYLKLSSDSPKNRKVVG